MNSLTFSLPPRQKCIQWVLLFVGCTLFITIINFALNGGLIRYAFGRPERTILAAVVLAAFLWIFRKDKRDLLATGLVYFLLLSPAALVTLFAPLSGIPPRIYSQAVADHNDLSIAISVLLMLVTSSSCFVHAKWMKQAIRMLSSILWFSIVGLPIVFVGYWISHRTILTPDIVVALYQTNLSEAWEYVLFKGGALIYVLVGALLLLTAITLRALTCRQTLATRNASIGIAMVVVAVFAVISVLTAHSNLYRDVFRGAQEIVQDLNAFKEELAKRQVALGALGDLKNQGNGGLYLVVLGESQTRSRMSAYGYERDTTPWLSSKRSDRHFVLLDNAYACFPNTVSALSNALTAKNQYVSRSFAASPSVVEIIKAAGYESWWISNQNRLGVWDAPTSVIANLSDHQVWLNSTMIGKRTRSKKFDEELIGELQKVPVVGGDKKVVFLHMHGCHANYETRYPENFTYWTDTESKLDTYDNAMRYSDDVLRRIYDVVKGRPDFRAMIFMSDHGEDVNLGHTPDSFTWDMVRIPLWIAASDRFLADHQREMETLRSNARKPFTNDLFFDLFCGLLGIKNTPYYEEAFDISSPEYNRPLQTLKTMFGKKGLSEDPLLQPQGKAAP